MTRVTTIIIFLISSFAKSQTGVLHHQMVATSQGASFKLNNGFSITQTVGQIGPIGGGKNSKYIVQQGFQQSRLGQYSVTTLKPNESTFKVEVFPNPFISSLNFTFTPQISGDVRVDFFDASGKFLYGLTRAPINNLLSISSLESLPVGIYLVNLKGSGLNQSFKIIKN